MSSLNPIYFAIPGFLLLLFLEVFITRNQANYEVKDTAASLTMGFVSLLIRASTGFILAGLGLFLYQHCRVFDIKMTWWSFTLLFFLEDFCFYWAHRYSHESRWLWASHVIHHSSKHFNLSTALRQSWTGLLSGRWIFWMPLIILGFPLEMVVFQQLSSSIYQFLIHTNAVKSLGPLEWVLNTPKHHRVHHAKNLPYLDKNYGGILIIWDRLFGTFAEETSKEPAEFGLLSDLASFNPLKIAFHEWRDILIDAYLAPDWRARIRYLFASPGWSHDGRKKTVKELVSNKNADVQKEVVSRNIQPKDSNSFKPENIQAPKYSTVDRTS